MKTILCYDITEDMPYVFHRPYGEDCYNNYYNLNTKDMLIDLIYRELDCIEHSLNKYDSVYQPENKQMCDELKSLKNYLSGKLIILQET